MPRRAITPEDLYDFRFVSDPRISPDGARVAYVVRGISEDRKKYHSHLWVDRRPFTGGTGSDSLPRWSPDGAFLAFVRTMPREKGQPAPAGGAGSAAGLSQVWMLPADGGEARALTKLPDGSIQSLDWSPDASRLAMTFHPTPLARPEGPANHDGEAPLFRRITRLHYKEEDIGFLDGERSHVWVADARTGAARAITSGDWDDMTPSWSPDGRFIAFASNRSKDADWHPVETDLWVVPARGGKARKVPTPAGLALSPQWSPDGRTLAWLGHDRPDASWGTANTHVWVVPSNGHGTARDLLSGYDRTCEDLVITDTKSFHGGGPGSVWSPDGRTLTFLASDSGSCHLYRVEATRRGPKGKGPVALTRGPMEVMSFSIAASGRTAVAISDPKTIGEVYMMEPRKRAASLREMSRVSSANDMLFRQFHLAKAQRFPVRSADGTRVQGWLMKPLGWSPRRKYPAILQIHGGPRAMYGEAFFHEFQLLAAAGYGVLFTNPRGSQGYGEAFTSAILNDWGNRDFADLMAATDALATERWVDQRRLGVCGGSYGGYMTNWIVGHTRRFRAAITMRSVTNLYSFYGTSDIGPGDADEFGGHAFDDPKNYWRQSPMNAVKAIRTPLLILHSEQDLRCPVEQAEELYVALKQQKRPVEFIRFPEENHDLSRAGRPDRRIARLRLILDWWDRRL